MNLLSDDDDGEEGGEGHLPPTVPSRVCIRILLKTKTKTKTGIHVAQTERQCHTWDELLNQYIRNDRDVFGDGRWSFV